jgi:dCTP deaminase
MILADWEIKALCESGMVKPFNTSLVNPASLDLRLGNTILIESAESPRMVPVNIADCTAESPYELVPGQFVLAQTMEEFHLPDFISAQFVLKSSRAREGFEHLMAGYCDPGWHGSVLTLELHNSRQLHRIGLWPGMKIGQMVFHRMSSHPIASYAETGNYNNHPTVNPSIVAA